MACICMKLDQIALWNYNQVFWSYWIAFALFSGSSLGLFLLASLKIAVFLQKRSGIREIFGLLWVASIMSSITIGSFLLVLGVSFYYEKKNEQMIIVALYVNLALPVLVSAYSLVFKNKVTRFFVMIADLDNNEEPSVSNEDSSSNSQVDPYQDVQSVPVEPQRITLSAPKKLTIPQYLVAYDSDILLLDFFC